MVLCRVEGVFPCLYYIRPRGVGGGVVGWLGGWWVKVEGSLKEFGVLKNSFLHPPFFFFFFSPPPPLASLFLPAFV